MRNTIYYELKKILKNNGESIKIDKINSIDFIKGIDKISRSILELGISNKDNIVIQSNNSIKYLELLYSFSKLGLSVTIIDDDVLNKNNIIDKADYLFISNIDGIEIDNYKRIIVYDNLDSDDDIVINWDKFCDISKYYNKEILYFDNFNIKYYSNNVELNINDSDIIESIDEYNQKLNIKEKNICVKFMDFILINYLIMNKKNISFSEGNVLITRDKYLLNDLNGNYKNIYSKFDMINEYELSKILEKYGSCYNRYYGFRNRFIGIGKDGNINLIDLDDVKICDVITGRKIDCGSIEIKVNKKYIKTNYIGYIVDSRLNIIDYLDKEIERVKIRKTGLPEIDMPWCKYYPSDSKKDKPLEYTLYQNLKVLNENNYLEVALKYLGREIKYFELFNEIEKAAKSLYALGVRKGDHVTFSMPNIPEFVYLFYAVNKIGAVACLIEPRTPASRIKDYLDESHSKVLVMVDLCKKNIDKLIDREELKHVISVSPMNSVTSRKVKNAYNLTHKKVKTSGKYIDYKDFIKIGESILQFSDNPYTSDEVATVVYTSGTTGKPKGAELRNETYNGQNMQLKYSGILPRVGEIFMGNVPFFSAYGSSSGMHNALSSGVTIELIANYKPSKFANMLKKYKPTHVMGVPRFFEILSESKTFNGEDITFLKNAISGGDKMSPNREYRVNEYLTKHNANKLKKGLGMSEFGGGFITTVNDEVNKVGSVGIPHVGNNIMIIDPDTNEHLTYGRDKKIGELYVTGPTMMKGYLNNKEENEKFFYVDSKGIKWAKTGDLVYMDEDGVIFFVDRIKNVIMRPDGHTVPLLPIENAIDKHEVVESCAVVGVTVSDKSTGKRPMAFIVLKKDNNVSVEKIHNEIKELQNKYIPEREQPMWYRYVDSLPYNLAGKVDLHKLGSIGEEDENKNLEFVNNMKKEKN